MRTTLLITAVLLLAPCAAWPQGSPVGPEFRVNTFTPYNQGSPAIAVDASGNFVVIWERYASPFLKNLFGQRYASSGAPLGAEFQLLTLGNNSAPAVGADAGGNFVVVWENTPLMWSSIFGLRYSSLGGPIGTEFTISSSGYNYDAAVARDPAGNFVVAWTHFPAYGAAEDVFARRYAGSGAPLSFQFRVNTYTTNDQSLPSVAADSSGNFVIVWSSTNQDGPGLGIFGQRYASSGAPLGSEFRVNTYATFDQALPSVAADSSGNFVVAWESNGQDGSGDGIFGQRYSSSGVPLGAEFRVNTYTTANQERPAVAGDAAGNFVVTWRSLNQDGSGYGIFGQRYDAAGSPLGLEFRINTHSTGSQLASAVAANVTGDFVVVWQSAGQDGSGYGVFGQRYLPILPVELIEFGVE